MQNGDVFDSHLHQEIQDIKKHVQEIGQQGTGFVEKIAKIEVQQETIKEQQKETSKNLATLQKTLTNEMHSSVDSIRAAIGERITDMSKILISQQETQSRIIDIQSQQGVQIEEIRKTLEEFTKVQAVTNAHEARIAALEKQIENLNEVNNTHAQGKWAVITAIASGILALIGTILVAVIK